MKEESLQLHVKGMAEASSVAEVGCILQMPLGACNEGRITKIAQSLDYLRYRQYGLLLPCR